MSAIRIGKLRLKNFKSFKKAVIPFSKGFTTIAGSNGSGKCVSGDTRIQLADGSWERADSLVEKALTKSSAIRKMDDGLYTTENPFDIEIASLHPETMKIEKKKVDAFIKRTSPKKMAKIKTRSGREIISTPYHPLFTLKDGNIIASKAENISKGTLIAVPRKLIKEKTGLFFEELVDSFKPKDNLFAPKDKKLIKEIKSLKKNKKMKMREFADFCGIPYTPLKSLFEGQAMNIAYLIKILKSAECTKLEIAKKIPYAKGKTHTKKIRIPWSNSKEFSRFLGYALAEGSNRKLQVRIVNENKGIIKDIEQITKKIFKTNTSIKKYKKNAYDLIIYSEPLGKILDKFGFKKNGKTKEKFTSQFFIKHSGNKELAELLNGLYSGNGYIAKNTVNIVSASKKLATNICTILLQFGIRPIMTKRTKKIKSSGFSGNYWHIAVYGKKNMKIFEENIKLEHNPKRNKLNETLQKESREHSNTDIIPGLNETVKKTCKELGIKPMRKKNRNSRLQAYCRNMCEVSRHGLKKLIEEDFSVNKKSLCLEKLKILSDSDIFWDEVKEIEFRKPKQEYVYDLAISGHHNFIANNVFVHNSNILDAIMFVLGMTSLKMMRASKLVDLVNKEAKEDYALVEMQLNQPDKKYLISRTIDKQGKSVYRIDSKRSALNEVVSLLSELGISATGYNIVVQGDVTKIIEMNPNQRREIIDDLAGLNEFDHKKEEAIKELEKVNTKIKEINIVLKERETYLDELEKERKAAIEYQDLTKEHKQTKATILKKEIKKIEGRMEENKRKIEKIKEKIEITKKTREETEKKEIELAKKTEEINNKIIDAKEKTYSGVGMEIEETKSEKRIMEERINLKKENINRLKNRIHGITEKQQKEKEKQENMDKNLEEIKRKIESSKIELNEKTVEAEKEKNRIKEIKEKIEEIETELEKKSEFLEREKERFFSKKSESEKLEKEITMNSSFLKEIQEDLNNQKLKEKSLSLKRTEKKLKEMENELNETEKKNPEIKEEIIKLKEIKNRMETEIKEILLALDELGGTEREERIQKEKEKAEILFEETEKEKEKINELLEGIKKEREETKNQLTQFKEEVLTEHSLIEEVNNTRVLLKEMELKRDSIKENLKDKEETKSDSGTEIKEIEEEIIETEKNINTEEEKIKETEKKIKLLTIELEKQNRQSHLLYEEKDKINKKMEEIKEKKTKNEGLASKLSREENEARIDDSKNEVRIADLSEEIKNFEEIELIEGKELGELKERLGKIEKRITELGAVNMKAIGSFEGQAKELIEIKEKSQKLDQERIAVLDMIEKIEIKRATSFMDCFTKVNEHFKKTYYSLGEKEGTLKLTDETDISNSGLLIEAKYDQEKMINIDSMSGGEKTLTALAFLFSIQLFRPAPFYIFDEADAALDKSNSLKLSKMIAEVCKKSQFIAITHNDSLIKESDQIIGVTLNEQKSSVIGLKLKEKLEQETEKKPETPAKTIQTIS